MEKEKLLKRLSERVENLNRKEGDSPDLPYGDLYDQVYD